MSQTSSLDWKPANKQQRTELTGRFIRLAPLDASHHGDDLWRALQGPESDPRLWDYLSVGPFTERAVFDAWLANCALSADPLFFTVIDAKSSTALGVLSLMRIAPNDGCIEIGYVTFGHGMQRSPASTEAVYLLARLAFDLGYRRLEWKCNAQNQRSKRAAERLGFVYEGMFRQHMVVKGQNRDTCWFSIINSEWPSCRQALEQWLAEDNFDLAGQQKTPLAALRPNV